MSRYLVIIEKGATSYGAYVPDLPACAAVGDSREEVERSIREAIEMHLQGMAQDHEPIPTPSSEALVVDVPAPNHVV